MSNASDYRQWVSPRRKRFWVLVVALVYILAGFFVAPPVVKHQLTSMLGETLQRPVTIGDVRINPLALSVTLADFQLAETDGSNLVSFEELYINFAITSPFYRAWTFSELSLVNPIVDVTRQESGALNLLALMPEEQPEVEPETSPAMPSLLFHELEIVGGTVHVTDAYVDPTFTTTFSPVDLRVTDVGTRADQTAQHDLVLFSETGAQLQLSGELTVVPFAINGRIDASGPYLPLAYEYIADELNVRLEKGNLDLGLNVAVRETAEALQVEVDNVSFALSDVLISDKSSDAQMLSLNRLSLSGFRFAWPDKMLRADELRLSGSDISLIRRQDGQLNWQELVASGEPESAAPDENVENVEKSQVDTEPANDPQEPVSLLPDWTVSLSALAIEDTQVRFEDHTLAEPAQITLAEITLAAETLSNTPNQPVPVNLSAALGDNGTLSAAGQLQLLPTWEARADVTLKDLPLPLFQPYVADSIRAQLDSGVLNATGSLNGAAGSPFSAGAELAVTDLALLNADDGNPLVTWESISVAELAFEGGAPASAGEPAVSPSLAAGSVLLAQPYLQLTIYEDSSTNFHRLLIQSGEEQTPEGAEETEAATREPSDETESPPPAAGDDAAGLEIAISDIQVRDGTIDFADFALPIPFEDKLSELEGELLDYHTAGKERATLELAGKVARYGTVAVNGQLSPWDILADTDLALDMTNIDLPNLDPYSIKFVGRRIESGKMNLDLAYALKNSDLQGSNNIVLTEFALGEKVPHEGALNLPLELAVALLKGPGGTIDIDLPVSGDTKNPEFSIASIVSGAFANLITKAVTAPFRLLSRLVGAGADDFDRVYFAPGSAEVAPPQLEKLHQLADALVQRPQLVLELSGVFSPDADTQALQAKKLEEELDALREELFSGVTGTPRSRQQLAAMEELFRRRLSETRLQELQGPFDLGGETVPAEYRTALRQQLLQASTVAEADLRALAQERAKNVRQALTAAGKLEAGRLESSDTATVTKAEDEGVPLALEIADTPLPTAN